LSDRSLGCIILIDDERTYRDALKYVEAVRLDDLQGGNDRVMAGNAPNASCTGSAPVRAPSR
jgi:hypothetical protein